MQSNQPTVESWLAERKCSPCVRTMLTFADANAFIDGKRDVTVSDLFVGMLAQDLKQPKVNGAAATLAPLLQDNPISVDASFLCEVAPGTTSTYETVSLGAARVWELACQLADQMSEGFMRVRYLVAALLTRSALEEIGEANRLDLFRDAFLNFIRRDAPKTFGSYESLFISRHYTFFDKLPPAPAAEVETTSADQPQDPPAWNYAAYANDGIGANPVDCLNVRQEWEAFARVIVSEDAAPPLAIGLFGDWGSGKSFFMNGLHQEVGQLAKRAQAGTLTKVCRHIVQVRFNAWHYMDAVLWSNLVGEVFEQLSGYYTTQPDWKEARADLVEKLGVAKVQLGEAQARKEAAEEARRKAQTQVEDLQRQIEDRRKRFADVRFQDVVAYVATQPEVKHRLSEASQRLGLPDEKALATQIEATKGDLGRWQALFLALAYHRSAALKVVGLALIAPLVVLALGKIADLNVLARGIAAVVATATTVWTAIQPYWNKAKSAEKLLKGAHDALTNAQKAAPSEMKAQEETLGAELKNLESAAEAAQKELDARTAEVRVLDERLEQIRQDRQLADFVRARCASDDYRKHEGLVSVVRDDFERLSQLMTDAKAEDDGKGESKYIERIVLYIDDLDRCPASRVVEVLQAVHLLLAFPLFVVVVGIDPNWMESALRKYYRDEMGLSPGEGGVPENAPQRYLEKIFQIPFALRKMGEKESQSLMASLLPTEAPKRSETASPEATSEKTAAIDVEESTGETQAAPPVSPLGEDPERSLPPLPLTAAPLTLSTDERNALLAFAGLAPSPRAMKRFVNTFHLIRAMSPAEMDIQPAAAILAILIFYPDDGASILKQLHEGSSTLENLRENLKLPPEAVRFWKGFPTLDPASFAAALEWVPIVRRFSFGS